eukprot:2271374-Amphidinium_carterae.2
MAFLLVQSVAIHQGSLVVRIQSDGIPECDSNNAMHSKQSSESSPESVTYEQAGCLHILVAIAGTLCAWETYLFGLVFQKKRVAVQEKPVL